MSWTHDFIETPTHYRDSDKLPSHSDRGLCRGRHHEWREPCLFTTDGGVLHLLFDAVQMVLRRAANNWPAWLVRDDYQRLALQRVLGCVVRRHHQLHDRREFRPVR